MSYAVDKLTERYMFKVSRWHYW